MYSAADLQACAFCTGANGNEVIEVHSVMTHLLIFCEFYLCVLYFLVDLHVDRCPWITVVSNVEYHATLAEDVKQANAGTLAKCKTVTIWMMCA